MREMDACALSVCSIGVLVIPVLCPHVDKGTGYNCTVKKKTKLLKNRFSEKGKLNGQKCNQYFVRIISSHSTDATEDTQVCP